MTLSILFKSSLSSFAEEFISWTTEKREVSSANSLTMEVKPSSKSFTWIKNNRGPKTEELLEELLQ